MSEKLRIAKYISQCGYASRRGAEDIIAQGRVFLNGNKVAEPATFIVKGDEVVIDGNLIQPVTQKLIWLFYKPRGIVCTRNDELGRQTIYDILPEEFKNHHYVGRLDLNSEGLLLITNSAEVKTFYEHPKNNLERVYEARVYGELWGEKLKQVFSKGSGKSISGNHNFKDFKIMDNETGKMMIYSAKIEPIKLGEDSKNHWLRFTLKEGKNREIRRICQHYELSVSKLKRVQFGEFFLGSMQPGDLFEV